MGKTIAYIIPGNCYLCPYIKLYLDNIDVDYDIISWNRESIDEKNSRENVICYERPLKKGSIVDKIAGYFGFYNFCRGIIKKNNYKGIVLLNTVAALIMFPYLHKYKNRYILDVRDYTGEKNSIIFQLVKRIVLNSYQTIISSEYYQEFLPKANYLVVHNIQKSAGDIIRKNVALLKNKTEINIGFVGSVGAYLDQQKKLILALKDSKKYKLFLIGSGSELLEEFCKENDIKNVILKGRFKPEEIYNLYENIDIVHNLYGNNVPSLDYALSNKLYFSAQLGMPLLACPNTAMLKESSRYGFGIEIDLDKPEDVELAIDNFIEKFEPKIMEQGCVELLQKVEMQNNTCVNGIKEFARSINGNKN